MRSNPHCRTPHPRREYIGQIDRIVATEESVLVVDYKTLRPAPASEAEIPALYLDQLAAYVAAIQAIYPKKRVRAALLWTDGPRLMPVSPERLQGDRRAGTGGDSGIM